MRKYQVARIRYRQVVAEGELHLMCQSTEKDSDLIERAKAQLGGSLQASKLKFEIQRA